MESETGLDVYAIASDKIVRTTWSFLNETRFDFLQTFCTVTYNFVRAGAQPA